MSIFGKLAVSLGVQCHHFFSIENWHANQFESNWKKIQSKINECKKIWKSIKFLVTSLDRLTAGGRWSQTFLGASNAFRSHLSVFHLLSVGLKVTDSVSSSAPSNKAIVGRQSDYPPNTIVTRHAISQQQQQQENKESWRKEERQTESERVSHNMKGVNRVFQLLDGL